MTRNVSGIAQLTYFHRGTLRRVRHAAIYLRANGMLAILTGFHRQDAGEGNFAGEWMPGYFLFLTWIERESDNEGDASLRL